MESQLTNSQVDQYCIILEQQIRSRCVKRVGGGYAGVYPVPMGGYPVAIRLSRLLNIPIVHDLTSVNVLIVDDLIDSGKTLSQYNGYDKAVLIVKNGNQSKVTYSAAAAGGWVTFPWEKKEDVKIHIERILQYIGEDPSRDGLKDTPSRVVKMWKEIFAGYDDANKPNVAIFKNGTDGIQYDQMIFDSGSFYSHCEHHMVPFFGQYYFAYIPSEKGNIIGLSKVARLIDFHCHKLQIQERLVHDVVEDIWKSLQTETEDAPLGMALIMKGEHLCKSMRGAKKKGQMIASKLKGLFLEDINVKNEFLSLMREV